MLASRINLEHENNTASQTNNQREINPLLPKVQQLILKNIGYSPASIDTIIERSKLSAAEVNANLVLLQVDDYIQSHPGGMISRKSVRK